MKRNVLIKNFTALLLCFAVALTCTAFPASAEEDDDDRLTVPQSAWAISVPQIRVTTEEGNGTTLQKEDGWQKADITITGTDGSMLADKCTFKVRGNTTALSWVKKKAFTFKFEKKKDVLGMGKGKKWALIANAFDPTLLRNLTAFELARELDIPYTSEYRVVELWVDNTFRGCYLLFEPVQEGKDRVDIDIDDGKDFLIEYEAAREEEDVTYFTAGGLRFIASEPDEPDEDELAYIKGTMERILNTFKSGSREEIEAVIDVDSFAKFYLLNEYMKTYDFDMSSVFFYYKDGKLYAGPPWDYDLSAGNAAPDTYSRAKATLSPEGTFADARNLYKPLCKNAWFMERVRAVYREHYAFMAQIGADGGLLDAARVQYAEEISRNYGEAGWQIGKWWINIQRQPYLSYDKNFDYLKSWCAARGEWMEQYYRPNDPAYRYGDANGDGVININDVTAIQRVLAEYDMENADAVRSRTDFFSNRYSVSNATVLQKHLADMTSVAYLGETRFYETI